MNAPIVCLGDLMVDVVALAQGATAPGSDTPATIRTGGGGSAANTAAWLAVTGHAVAFVGRVGDDAMGRAAVQELVAAGVDCHVHLDPDVQTGACVVVVGPDGDRTMFPDAGANDRLDATDLPVELIASAAVLHVPGYALLRRGSRPAALAALALARDAGVRVSVDPSSVAPLADVGPRGWLDWVRGADLLLANEDEARLLTGATSVQDAGPALADQFGEVVVKRGAAGATWFRTGQEPVSQSATYVPAVDTTGAGDAFAAGFLGRWVAGATAAEALATGAALAARVVGRAGARPA